MNPPSPSNPTPVAGDQAEPHPGARTALVLLLCINLFNYIDRYVLAAVVPQIRTAFFEGPGAAQAMGDATSVTARFLAWFQTAFGFTPANALIGALSMAFMVTYMIAAPVFGKLAERTSRWVLIGIGVVLWSLASGASGLATTFGMLLLTRCFVGVGEAAYGPVAPAVIADFYPIKVRGWVLSWFYMAIPVGSALGFVLGEQVAKAFGWRWAFYIVVLPGIALGAWAFFMREPKRESAGRADGASPPLQWRDYLVLFRTPSYVLNTLGMSAMTFAMGGIGFWMPDYVSVFRKVPGSTATIFGAITVLAGLAATLSGGVLGDKLRTRFAGSYFLVSGVAMVVGFPLFLGVLYCPFPAAWVFVFLAVFCLFFNTGPTNTILANVTHPAMRAAGFALNIFVIHALGDVISPLLVGLIADKYDMNAAFKVVGLMFLVAAACWLLGARYLARDTALAPTRLASAGRNESIRT